MRLHTFERANLLTNDCVQFFNRSHHPWFRYPPVSGVLWYAGAISCVHFPKVPFNVRQPQPKFFARCLVLVYFIYFPCVIKFSVLNIQKFFCQYTINTSTIEKNDDIHKFFLFEIVPFLWYTAYFPFLAVILASRCVSPKKCIPVPLYSKECVRGLYFEKCVRFNVIYSFDGQSKFEMM